MSDPLSGIDEMIADFASGIDEMIADFDTSASEAVANFDASLPDYVHTETAEIRQNLDLDKSGEEVEYTAKSFWDVILCR
jgi:hypothetical protein